MDINILKEVALMQFNDKNWIYHNGKFYVGNENQLYFDWFEYGKEQTGMNYGEWLIDKAEEVYPYEEDYSKYIVLTNEEAESLAMSASSALLFETLPEDFQNSWLFHYFDIESAIKDAIIEDGRGSLINHRNGIEHEETIVVDDKSYIFYIYEQ